MKTSPEVVRVWMPLLLGVMLFLFLQHLNLAYWLLALPLLSILLFMVALAEVHDENSHIRVNLLWRSRDFRKEDVLETGESFVEGIGVLHLRYFVFPWGRVFFVREWSAGQMTHDGRVLSDILVSIVLAISGFLAAHAAGIRSFKIEASQARTLALVSAGLLVVFFVAARRRTRGFANLMLFAAGYLIGLLRW